MCRLLDLSDGNKICIQSTKGCGEYADIVKNLLSCEEKSAKENKRCKAASDGACQQCTNNANLIIIIWCDHEKDFRPDENLEKLIFPPDSNNEKQPVPVLSLLFTPLLFLHNNSDLLHLDHRIGILDHSVWHRVLTIPADMGKISDTVRYMLQDPRYRTVVASEALFDLKDRYQYQERIGKTGKKGHPDTYKRKFVPRSQISIDIEKLLEKFKQPNNNHEHTKRAIYMIDDHIDHLNRLDDGRPDFGKKDACMLALIESFHIDEFVKNGYTNIVWDSLKSAMCKEDERNPFANYEWAEANNYEAINPFIEEIDNCSDENAPIEPIILLDFLFSEQKGGEYHFGTSLITKLSEEFIDKQFSMFFISSFPWGVIEESKCGTAPLHTGNLFIDLGEDPVCYPELFVKKLLQFILSREIRPLMNAYEIIKEADRELNKLLNEKDDDKYTSDDYRKVFYQFGVLSSYLGKLDTLRQNSLLDNKALMLMTDSTNVKKYKEIYRCMSRFLYSGLEDCRLVTTEINTDWDDLNPDDKELVSQELKKKLNTLKENILKRLKNQMDYF